MTDSKTYKFRVGVKDLKVPIIGPLAGLFGGNHACLILNEDIFEYGTEKKKESKNMNAIKTLEKMSHLIGIL